MGRDHPEDALLPIKSRPTIMPHPITMPKPRSSPRTSLHRSLTERGSLRGMSIPPNRRRNSGTGGQRGSAEAVVLVGFVIIVGLGLLLEQASPELVRIIAITFCTLLLLSMITGMVMRHRAKSRQALASAREWEEETEAAKDKEDDPPNPPDSARLPPGGTAVLLFLLSLTASAVSQHALPIQVLVPEGTSLSALASGGIPVPEFLQIRSAADVELVDGDGHPVPASIEVTARRPRGEAELGTARWLLLTAPWNPNLHPAWILRPRASTPSAKNPTETAERGSSPASRGQQEAPISSLSFEGKSYFREIRIILTDEQGTDLEWQPDHHVVEWEDDIYRRHFWSGPLGASLRATLRITKPRDLPYTDLEFAIENPGSCPFGKSDGTNYFRRLRVEMPFEQSAVTVVDGVREERHSPPVTIELLSERATRSTDWSKLLFSNISAGGKSERSQGAHLGVIGWEWADQSAATLARRDAAFEHPTSFRVNPEGLVIDLLPAGGTGPHYAGVYSSPHNPASVPEPRSLVAYRLEGGRHKVFAHRLYFSRGPLSASHLHAVRNSFDTPPLLSAHPEYLCGLGSPGFLISPFREDREPNRVRWQQFLRLLIDDNAADVVPNTGKKGLPRFLREGGNANHVEPYGWHNHGDLPWAEGYSSLHYDHPRSHFSAFIASGDRRFFDRGVRMLLHQRDLDMVHTTPADTFSGGQRYEKGWYHGNGMNPSQSHHWIGGIYLHYVLTGDPRSRQTLLEAGDYLLRINSHQWHGRYSARLVGWPLDNLVTRWLLDGDDRFRERARASIERFGELEQQDGGLGYVLNQAVRHDPSGTPASMQGWMHGIFLSAACRYVMETKDRTPLPLMKRVAQHLQEKVVVRSVRLTGRHEPAKCHNLWAPNGFTKATTTQYAWAPMAALAQMAYLTGDLEMWAVAEDLFESCIRFFGGPPPRGIPNFDQPSTWTPISLRMTFSNTESKIVGQISLFSMGFHWLAERMKEGSTHRAR